MKKEDVHKILAEELESARIGPAHPQSVQLENGELIVTLAVSPDSAKRVEAVRRKIEERLCTLQNVESASLIPTAQKQENESDTAPGGMEKITLPGVKKMIAVTSGKGGVGKSTVAVNLAVALAGKGLKVGLLDADVHGPSLPLLLGEDAGKGVEMEENRVRPVKAHGVMCMSIGFLVPEAAATIWRGPMIMSAVRQLLGDVAWGELDILIADLPPGTGDVPLTLAQQTPLDGAIVVSTPQDVALADVRRNVSMLNKTNVPVLGLVENMSTFVCPDCGAQHPLFGEAGMEKAAAEMNLPVLGTLPFQLEIRTGSDTGQPVAARPDTPGAEAFFALAETIREKTGL